MKRQFLHVGFPALILIVVLAGCGGTPAPTPTLIETKIEPSITPTVPTMTPDPCAPGQIGVEVQKVHKHMREFDDASALASNVPRSQLGDAVANLQKIRREAEDESVPDCLTNLKAYQVAHMNTVITTMLAFMSGTDQKTIDQGMSLASQQHDQYTLELARLLGLEVVPGAPTAPGTSVETPKP